VPPAAIYDLEGWTGDIPGTLFLRWTAPGDDNDEGRSQAYVVKTATVPILDEDDWEEASQKYNTPEPGIAGSVEEMTVFNCYPGTFLYATARAIDDFGNLSPLGNCILLLVRGFDASGIVYDTKTGLPIEGMNVSAGMANVTTGPDGAYLIENLPKYTQVIRVRDENIIGDRGDYYDLSYMLPELNAHLDVDLPMLPVLGMVSCYELNPRYDDFLVFLKEMTGTTGLLGRPTVYKSWRRWPLKVYNPPMEWMGVDLQETVRGSLASWEEGTGLDLFVEVDSPVDCDVEIVYFGTGEDKHKAKVIETYEDGAPKKKEIWIYLNNALSPIWIQGHMIFCHELGHILGVLHSVDYGHLMVGNT
ncbi:MAG TPA: hypothetical protein VLA34_06925, partial [Candidatus Krumholzibacterium sp.]|nr:hypothetical protein [Candidatus Krumholzibacterium sp.]